MLYGGGCGGSSGWVVVDCGEGEGHIVVTYWGKGVFLMQIWERLREVQGEAER
jgi:hypothetical protein